MSTPQDIADTPLDRLKSCAARLAQGPWKFIRLRGGGTELEAVDADDIDLLGTRESVHALLEAAFSWAREGLCHLRVKSTSRSKVGLHLISTDGNHRLDLDLWIELWQIDDRKLRLVYQDCAAAVLDPDTALQRLPVDLEAAVFTHHLVSKRKTISSPKQLARLERYATLCREASHDGLAAELSACAASGSVGPALRAMTLASITSRLHTDRAGRLRRRLASALSTAWFRPPGKLRLLGMMGCDGCGKTTLCKRLAKDRGDIRGTYTGKHLYRKWILYKLLVIFVRPLLFQGREKFDDTFAPLAYLLACIRLRLKLLFTRRGITLIDRSILDFLMVARKTDQPRFSRFIGLSSLFGVRLTHIHFIVPFERLKERKLEMTEAGHAIYDAEMFRRFSRRTPTDHLIFDNRGDLDASATALGRILDWVKRG